MAQDARAIKQEIALTRERMGDTVEALAYKADVPSRVKDRVHDGMDTVKDRIGDVVDNVKTAFNGAGGTVADAVDAGTQTGADVLSRTRDKVSATVANADVGASAQRAAGAVAENPLGLALGALAIGFVAGSMLPVSDAERARLKPIGDRLAEQAQATTNDLVAAGKAVAIETAQTAVAAALSSAKTHGQEVVDAAKTRAEV